MIIGVPKESYPGERRVALVPAVLANLAKVGLQVLIEPGAGAAAGYPDAHYLEKGARVAANRAEVFAEADIITQVLGAGANDKTAAADLPMFRHGQTVLGFLRPFGERETLLQLAATGVDSFSVELMPRTTRAQSMDALSSMATIAGYKAVILAADTLPRILPMLTTAAGTITPGRVLIIGVGVAGLQAIATARRLGAVTSAYDVRPAAKEQVLSLGARFVELPIEAKDAQDARGYATAQGEEFYRKQRELLGDAVAAHEVVITAAVIPGKKAPILVTKEMVARMAPGSVIVDLASERGGNCELTRPGESIIEHGVTIIGYLNFASSIPFHASQMYSRNLTAFLLNLVKDGKIQFNAADEIHRETLLTRGGDIVNVRVREYLGLPALAAEPKGT